MNTKQIKGCKTFQLYLFSVTIFDAAANLEEIYFAIQITSFEFTFFLAFEIETNYIFSRINAIKFHTRKEQSYITHILLCKNTLSHMLQN